MARPKEGDECCFPKWKPGFRTRRKFYSEEFRERYKALRNSSDNFIKRSDVREYIFRKYGGKCHLCGAKADLQIDHITSVYEVARKMTGIGMLNSECNLALICRRCNSGKAP